MNEYNDIGNIHVALIEYVFETQHLSIRKL